MNTEIKSVEEILDENYNKNLGFLSITYEQAITAMEAYHNQFKSEPVKNTAPIGTILKVVDHEKESGTWFRNQAGEDFYLQLGEPHNNEMIEKAIDWCNEQISYGYAISYLNDTITFLQSLKQ